MLQFVISKQVTLSGLKFQLYSARKDNVTILHLGLSYRRLKDNGHS